ncbi:STAS domain [Musa troglodytarum]|uniref:STAS domain n=1 Tax=Musa troglodytarum TaxID=320322 RepID=A0A9E7EFS9_9LILI|nr:STAS domain [Musa troglodytarum]
MPIFANTRRHSNRIAMLGLPVGTKRPRSTTNPRLFPAFPRQLIPLHVAISFHATPSFGPTRTPSAEFVRGSESSAGAPQPLLHKYATPSPPPPSLVKGSAASFLAPLLSSLLSDSPHRLSDLASSTMVTVENSDAVFPSGTVNGVEQTGHVPIPPSRSFLAMFRANLKETFFPDDPLRQFKNERGSRRFLMGLKYFFPVLEWLPSYGRSAFKSDLVAGITIASLAIPQGISYAKLANLPPILGLYSSFVPPLVYAMMGSSNDLAVGTVAVASLLIASMLGKEVPQSQNPTLYLHLAFSATFFAGVFQTSLGLLRLGFIVDFLSHATIVGFMAGAATVVCLQQLKGMLGLQHFTTATDLVSVMESVFTQTHQWRWESAVLGGSFLFFLFLTRFLSKKGPKFFWVSAAAPLTSVILGSLLVYFTHAENHGVQVIGNLKKGLNPPSLTKLVFSPPHMAVALKTGIITAIIALAEGIAVGRSFAMFKNYHIDGNKEMIAFGMMNIAGSFTSCYLTTGPFSRSAVNYNAGCKTAMSNVVMAVAVAITLLFLTPLFHYTPLVVLSAIIVAAMLGLINYEAAMHLWEVDKIDFCVCMGAYLGVVFGSVEIGLVIAVAISILRVLLFVARPRTTVLGNIPNSSIYRRMDQYSEAQSVPGVLILRVDAPVYFANASYLSERISRWMDEEEEKLQSKGEIGIHYVILDLGAVGSIDSSGIDMLKEINKSMGGKEVQLVLANPGSEVMKKLDKSKALETIRQQWIFLTVAEAVAACTSFSLHACKSDLANHETDCDSVV